jgi:hypothetical protein
LHREERIADNTVELGFEHTWAGCLGPMLRWQWVVNLEADAGLRAVRCR